jgi:hypothetical protein
MSLERPVAAVLDEGDVAAADAEPEDDAAVVDELL